MQSGRDSEYGAEGVVALNNYRETMTIQIRRGYDLDKTC